jgi:hypothetical protein
MNVEITDFEHRQKDVEGEFDVLMCIEYKKDIDFYKRQIDDKEENNKKLKITIHDLTVSYEGQKKENSNLKSIK